MARHHQVLSFLRPEGGYISTDETYEAINFVDCEPFTKAEYEAGFAQFDTWKTEQDEKANAAKLTVEAKLTALGLTADDLKALGL